MTTNAGVLSASDNNVARYIMSRWKSPEKNALETNAASVKYSELISLTLAMKSALYELGVTAGCRVVLIDHNSIAFVVALLAIMDIGAIEVTLPPDDPPARILRILQTVSPHVVISGNLGWQTAQTEFGKIRKIDVVDSKVYLMQREVPRHSSPVFDKMFEDGVNSINFTSGTTSQPKGVVHTTKAILATLFVGDYLAEHINQRCFMGIPLCNSYGKSHLLEYLFMSATVLLANGFGDPEGMWSALKCRLATTVEAPPDIFQLLVRSDGFLREGLPLLSRVGMAGGRVPTQLLKRLRNNLPQCALVNRYGVTEIAGPLCRICLEDHHINMAEAPCGKPMDWVDLRIMKSGHSSAQNGGRGEVVIHSPGLMWGYFPEKYKGDEYRSGDIGWINEAGELVLADRAVRFIKRSGVRISPAEIESILLQHPGVQQCVVCGVEKRYSGHEVVMALVVSVSIESRPSVAELIRHCRLILPKGHIPDRFVFCESIPLSETGKPNYKKIQAILSNSA